MNYDAIATVYVEPRPQARQRATIRGGHAATYMPAKTRHYRDALAAALRATLRPCAAGELFVGALFVFARPQRLQAKRHADGLIWHTVKPDLDNLDKALRDSLGDRISDDDAVAHAESIKAYAERGGRPRVVVRVRAITYSADDAARRLGLLEGDHATR